jgi:diphthamide biosynthesis methyltransferase
MNIGTLLGPLVSALSGFAVIGAVLLGTALILAGLFVYRFGASTALAFFRGEGKMVNGEFFVNDVYSAAMQDLHSQKRKGVLLDAEANSALKEYQGFSRPKRNRSGW